MIWGGVVEVLWQAWDFEKTFHTAFTSARLHG